MQIEEHQWFSPNLHRSMALKVYGHWGVPILVFPCSLGRYYDYEGMGMIDAITEFIDAGKIKLYCIDSVDAESWYHFSVSPAERNARHEAYDSYIVREVIPFIRTTATSRTSESWPTAAAWGPTTRSTPSSSIPTSLPAPSPSAVCIASTAPNSA